MAGKSELNGTKPIRGTATRSSALTSMLVCKGTLIGFSVSHADGEPSLEIE